MNKTVMRQRKIKSVNNLFIQLNSFIKHCFFIAFEGHWQKLVRPLVVDRSISTKSNFSTMSTLPPTQQISPVVYIEHRRSLQQRMQINGIIRDIEKQVLCKLYPEDAKYCAFQDAAYRTYSINELLTAISRLFALTTFLKTTNEVAIQSILNEKQFLSINNEKWHSFISDL